MLKSAFDALIDCVHDCKHLIARMSVLFVNTVIVISLTVFIDWMRV